jgi:hypothetical protein
VRELVEEGVSCKACKYIDRCVSDGSVAERGTKSGPNMFFQNKSVTPMNGVALIPSPLGVLIVSQYVEKNNEYFTKVLAAWLDRP